MLIVVKQLYDSLRLVKQNCKKMRARLETKALWVAETHERGWHLS